MFSGLVGAGLGAIGNVYGSIQALKGQREANKANIAMQNSANQTNIALAQGARDHDVAMWNRQNEYNTPQMQMQRLQEAGLNPNLIYEGGAGSAGNASPPPKATAAEVQSPKVQNEMAAMTAINMMPMISAFQDWQVKKAQIDNLQAQTDTHTETAIGQRLKNLFETKLSGNYDSLVKQKLQAGDLANTLASTNIDKNTRQLLFDDQTLFGRIAQRNQESKNYLQYGNEISKYSLENLKNQNRQRKLDIQFQQELKPFGMHQGDQLWQRMLVPIMMKLFGDPRKSFNP